MSLPPSELRALYEAVYSEPSPAHEAVRRDGHLPGDEIDQCGYTLPEQLRELARRLKLGPGRRLLDVGCGRGGPTLYLARHTGCDAVGLDFAQHGVATARRKSVDHRGTGSPRSPMPAFLVGDAAALPLRDGCCDAVVSLDAVLYLPDRDGFLRECLRVLRPGGGMALVDEVERGGGLLASEREARALFGSALYDTVESHLARLRRLGFARIVVEDWTAAFVALNERWVAARERHRAAFVAEGGHAAYEAGQRYFVTNRDAARAGRLARMLFLARKETG